MEVSPFAIVYFWDEKICPLFGGVRCIEVSVSEGSTVFNYSGSGCQSLIWYYVT